MIISVGYRVRSQRGVQFRIWASGILKGYMRKSFYRQILEIYATSIDYDPTAEVIYHRVNAEKEFMGLMSFSGEHPTLKEAKIAKNYLNEKELRAMGQLVSGYLDFWAEHLDRILVSTGEQLLEGNGSISHIQAMNKAETEYKKYKQKTISSVEREYLDVIKQIQKDTKK